MSEMLEYAKTVLSELTALHEEGWCACQSSSLPARVQAALGDLIEALSSPPADDVREALADTVLSASPPYRLVATYEITDAILARFEVRPYGTVTEPSDEEVLTALNATVKPQSAAADLSFWGDEATAQMRASLKAAAEVRERAEA